MYSGQTLTSTESQRLDALYRLADGDGGQLIAINESVFPDGAP